MNLVLIGYRGTGKSVTARLLGQRIGWSAYDADDEIERLAGKTIARIFADDGEAAFRDWESRVIADLAARPACVLALGGGAILRPENRAVVATASQVVWLTASADTICRRLQADAATAARRPNLTPAGGITEIIATLQARSPIYRQCARMVVDTENKTPAEVADAILAECNPAEGA